MPPQQQQAMLCGPQAGGAVHAQKMLLVISLQRMSLDGGTGQCQIMEGCPGSAHEATAGIPLLVAPRQLSTILPSRHLPGSAAQGTLLAVCEAAGCWPGRSGQPRLGSGPGPY